MLKDFYQSTTIRVMVVMPAVMFLATLRLTVEVALIASRVYLHRVILQSMTMHAMAGMPAILFLATL
jgi:hypothetical protein